MPTRIALVLLLCALAGGATYSADFESARALYLSGDLDGARTELEELLGAEASSEGRAPALELLGRIAADRKDWPAALEAWGELTNDHALSAEAAAVSSAIRPLQALVDCGCAAGESMIAAAGGATPPASGAPAKGEVERAASGSTAPGATLPAPQPPTPSPAPAPVADGTLIVGGTGAEYDASQEATARLVEFLAANGVPVRAASTEVPAIRGKDVVLSYLVEEARASGAAGVLFVTTRFNFREFIQVDRYDPNGVRLWREKLIGGTALKERRDRDKPSWGLVERMEKKLGEKLGTPELSTEP